MSNENTKTFWRAAAALGVLAVFHAFAEEQPTDAEPAAEEAKVDEALQSEIDYVEALVDNGFPDFAGPVIEATKKKWPEADAMFFAIEVRGLLSLGRFDEANAKIAALPDRDSPKFWAARLEVANNYNARGNKKECEAIYSEFFKKHEKPTRELKKFYRDACWLWGQILVSGSRHEEAVRIYEKLLSILAQTKGGNDEDAGLWANVACETAEMYIKLANDADKPDVRKKYIAPAKKLVDELLWDRERFWLFGRAVAMKANLELLGGDIARAQATISDYYSALKEIHENLERAEANGAKGWLKQSPMPLCRYMLARMLWDEAQAEFKKPKRDDEKIKDLLFGKKTGKKRGGNGAFNHSVNVFIQFPWSQWAIPAGEMSEKIRAFAESTYGAKIATKVTPEQMANVRATQFKNADEKFVEGDYAGALADYETALSGCPEFVDSVRAIENIVMIRLNQIARGRGTDAEKTDWRMDADAIEGYLAERFAGHRDRAVMTAGGDAALRLASVEKERGDAVRADAIYRAVIMNYRRYAVSPNIARAIAQEAQREKRYGDAMWYFDAICTHYTNSAEYADSLFFRSQCQEAVGDRPGAIGSLLLYCDVEKSTLKRTTAQMQLAQLYKQDGQDILASASTNEAPEAVAAQERAGSAQIVRAMKQFKGFAGACEKMLADPAVPQGEKARYGELREGALYLVGECWTKMTKPDEKLENFRRSAAAAFEEYVGAFPKGRYAKAAYVRLGTIYTTLGDTEGSKNALARLSKEFPDSPEAKDAMPRLAKSLVEMGFKKEGTEIYAGMLKTDGAYRTHQFVNAGEALIEAGSWELADQAFEKAIAMASSNETAQVARARIGQARSLFRQRSFAEARAQLDLFFADGRLSRQNVAAEGNLLLAEIAAEQGRTEKDDTVRRRHFNAAVGAIKKLRTYWRSRPQDEQDRIDLMSADIVIKRMQAEDAMDLRDQAQDTCALAAQMLQTFLQTRAPDAEHPLSSMTPGAVANLEAAYAKMIPLFSRLGDGQADRVMTYGAAYLELFPDGGARTEVINCMNKAKTAAPAQTADAAVREETAENEGGNENE